LKDTLTVARDFMKALDAQDWKRVEAMLDTDCEVQHPAMSCRGRAQAVGLFQMITPFEQTTHEIASTLELGKRVMIEGVWRGTHTRAMQTPAGAVPPTGRTVAVPFCVVAESAGELMRSIHMYSDQMAFMAQLGLMGAPPAR
jgi:predicted ester cyclase